MDERLFSTGRVCVVGNINRDVKIAPIAPDGRLFSDGETSTDFVHESFGGGGANSALAATALGATVSFVGKIGSDAWGDRLENRLRQCGVRSHLIRAKNEPTGTSVNLVFNSGHRHFVSHLPSSRSFCFQDIGLEAFSGMQHLLRADIWFSDEMLFGGNYRLFSLVRKHGLATSVDINWDPEWNCAASEIIAKRKEAVRSILPLTDLVHGNVRELTCFAETDDLRDALRKISSWGARAIVVHQGRLGAGFWSDGEYIQQPPIPAAQSVNTTGTGDVLSICMILLHHLRTIPVQDKLRFANQIVSEYISGKRTLMPPLEICERY